MSRRRRIYEGKATRSFSKDRSRVPWCNISRTTPARSTIEKKGVITGKGVINNRISEYLMLRLHDIGVPTHFIRRLNMREQLIRQVEIIPLEVVIRNVAAGSLAGALSAFPRVRRCRDRFSSSITRTKSSTNPLVTEEHITAFGWASPPDLDDIISLALANQ